MWSKLIKASFNIPQIEKLIIFKLFFSWFCLLIFWPLYKKTENPDFSWISNQTIIQPTNNYSCFYFRKSEQLSIQTLCGQFVVLCVILWSVYLENRKYWLYLNLLILLIISESGNKGFITSIQYMTREYRHL